MKEITELLLSYGIKSWICGGTARELYMDMDITSYDIAVACELQELKVKVHSKIILTDDFNNFILIQHLGVSYNLYPLKQISMVNTYYRYNYTDSLEEDSNCRDFTMNALYYDVVEDKYIDFHNGAKDIDDRIIRFVGNPVDRILESKVRILRAFVFLAVLGKGWSIADRSLTCITDFKLRIVPVNAKQLYPELVKLMDRALLPSAAFYAMRSSWVLEDFCVELNHTTGIEQSNKTEGLDLFTHIMLTMDSIPFNHPNKSILRLAALLHDIGKPYTKFNTPTGTHFYNHDNIGSYLAERILTRWGFPKHVIAKITLLVVNHLFDASPAKSDSSIKKLIARVGMENIYDLLDLRVADRRGTGRVDISMEKIELLRQKIKALTSESVVEAPKLELSDKEIKQQLTRFTDYPDEVVIEVVKFLEKKILSGDVQNKPQSLKNAIMKVNKIQCPLDKKHLFTTWTSIQNNSVDTFENGLLKCGVFCGFLCNNQLRKSHKE